MKKYKITNLDCASCAARIEEGVRHLDDVRFVSVNFATASITIDTNNIELVKKKIKEIEPEAEIGELNVDTPWVSAYEIVENKPTIIRAIAGLFLLVTGFLVNDNLFIAPNIRLKDIIFISAYLITGYKVIILAVKNIVHGQVFSEYFLMTLATLGAIAIGSLPEAVAVMLFYVTGEFFQDLSVNRSRKSIQSLLELKPKFANIKVDGQLKNVSPESLKPGDIIVVKAGEKIPVDGKVLSGNSFVDTSALTGEHVPRKIRQKDEVLSGMINQNGVLTVVVTKSFGESSISKILELVENASSRKAETEKFITTFAKYYTPVVVLVALLLATLPPLLLSGHTFSDWIYRALVVLVVSCPCALVISIPLGYFGGIGAASRRGILVKGSNFMDALTQIKTVVFDKTGTLTKGTFKVTQVVPNLHYSEKEVLHYAGSAEILSNHPIALSIMEASDVVSSGIHPEQVEELPGLGIKATINEKIICVGNASLMSYENIKFTKGEEEAGTIVYVAVDNEYIGYIVISDNLKHDALEATSRLHDKNINTVMLTGDNEQIAKTVSSQLKIPHYYAQLLPAQKVEYFEKLMLKNNRGKIAFVGDGINDAPVIARADIGFAMGALGSDAAIEIADVVLMTDSPSKVADAIDIANKTRTVVWQNIFFALGVKLVFIVLGIAGIASMWEAVFGDMGVALIAIFNAMRVLKHK
ncbi:MAG TPA: heavy metal translocating P-type ATPase [Mariniphaga sp.]|nr:heavy metal translocating P-type ATPase [Mariniphaga sp.]